MLEVILFLLQAVLSARQPLTDDDYLSVSQGRFVTKSGNTILLQGCNIGGWLIQESWMTPVNGFTPPKREWANLNSIQALESRNFTIDQIYELYTIYEDNWFTTADLDILAEIGITAIRVPFWYRNFMLTPEGQWINDDLDQNPGFQKLDWVLSEAGKRGIYVILDMHGAPGGQSTDDTTGTLESNDLYTTPAYIEAMKKLWVAIAARYKDHPAVAMYDLMNEPNDNNNHGKHPYDMDDPATWDLNNMIFDIMYKGIREVDPRHLVCMETCWVLSHLPNPVDMGWEGVVYQMHFYNEQFGDEDAIQEAATELSAFAQRWNVGAYNGEFYNMDTIAICQKAHISWTTWTYKGGREREREKNDQWFIYYKDCEEADTTKDDYDTIKEKWGAAIRTENGFTASGIGQILKDSIGNISKISSAK